jgi:glycosyltransferase involved in cell wall biosynthesis
VRELAAASARLGHEVTVYAPDYGRDLATDDAQSLPFKVRRFAAGLRAPFAYPRYAQTCLAVARDKGVDRILAADIPFVEMMAATYPLHRRRYEAMAHGSDINKERYSLRGFLLRPARVFHRPARICVNSRFTQDLLLERYPALDPARVTVTPLGLAQSWFDPPAGAGDIRAELGIDPERTVIATVARITPRKGQLALMQAAACLSESQRRRLSFVLAGSSSGLHDKYLRAVKAAAAEAAPAQVILPGSLPDDDVKRLYRAAYLFCLPGALDRIEVEGFGLAFLEAAAQGLPAVAGAVGGTPEVVRDGETGILVPPDNPAALAEALWRVVGDLSLRDALAEHAVAAARDFTWERCARQTFGPCNSLATKPATAAALAGPIIG